MIESSGLWHFEARAVILLNTGVQVYVNVAVYIYIYIYIFIYIYTYKYTAMFT